MTKERFKCGQGKISVVEENLIFKLLSLFARENQELRTKNNTYIQDVEAYREENTHLKLENEKLKNIIVFAYTLMSMNTISDEEYSEFYELCENIGVSLND